VVKACSDPGYADPGKRCIADRSRGGNGIGLAIIVILLLTLLHVIQLQQLVH